MAFGGEIAISNEVTYYYIQRQDSAIRTTDFRRFELIGIFENLAEFYKKLGKNDLANLITTSRIPKAIFGNMNYFFYNNYDFDEVISKIVDLTNIKNPVKVIPNGVEVTTRKSEQNEYIFIQNFNNQEVDIELELKDAKIILGEYLQGKIQKFETIVIKSKIVK